MIQALAHQADVSAAWLGRWSGDGRRSASLCRTVWRKGLGIEGWELLAAAKDGKRRKPRP